MGCSSPWRKFALTILLSHCMHVCFAGLFVCFPAVVEACLICHHTRHCPTNSFCWLRLFLFLWHSDRLVGSDCHNYFMVRAMFVFQLLHLGIYFLTLVQAVTCMYFYLFYTIYYSVPGLSGVLILIDTSLELFWIRNILLIFSIPDFWCYAPELERSAQVLSLFLDMCVCVQLDLQP